MYPFLSRTCRCAAQARLQWLTEKSHQRHLGLAHMDQPPVVLARDWILVALAQEANLVRVLELLDVRGIRAELLVVELDRALVLQSARHRLPLLVALDLFRYLGRSHRQRQQHQEDHHQHGQQQVALFGARVLRFRSGLT